MSVEASEAVLDAAEVVVQALLVTSAEATARVGEAEPAFSAKQVLLETAAAATGMV